MVRNLAKYKISEPTPIQMQAVPILIDRRDAIACAPTGSGKSIAFLLPILWHIKRHRNKGCRALIITPTRELGRQIYRDALRLSQGTDIRVAVFGQTDSENGKMANKKGKCRFGV